MSPSCGQTDEDDAGSIGPATGPGLTSWMMRDEEIKVNVVDLTILEMRQCKSNQHGKRHVRGCCICHWNESDQVHGLRGRTLQHVLKRQLSKPPWEAQH